MAAYAAERWQAGDFTAVREAVSPDEEYAGDFARDLFGNLLGTLLCEMLEHGSLKDSAAARELPGQVPDFVAA